MRRFFGIALAAAAPLLIGACESLPWLGGGEAAPLPGERISVLVHERTLVPDPEAAKTQIVLPPPSPTAEWPLAGGFANHAMHHLEVNANLKRAWDSDIGAGASDTERLVAPPVVADGKVFTLDTESTAAAFDFATGRELWDVDLTPDDEDGEDIGGGVGFEDGRLYVATGFGHVVALNANDGTEVWRVDLKGPIRVPPTVRGGRVFVVSVDNKLTALNGHSGEVLWTYQSIGEVASLLGGASPAEDAGVLVVAFSSGEIAALRVENGRVLWTDSLGAIRRTDVISAMSHIRGRPVIDRGMVFALSNAGMMAAIDLRTGRRVWDKDVGGIESPWIAGDYLYILSSDAEVICLSRIDGRVFWVTPLQRYEDEEDREDPILWTGPVLASDRLIVAGSHGVAETLSPYTGQLLGSEELPDGVASAPVIADRSVIFLSNDGTLALYR